MPEDMYADAAAPAAPTPAPAAPEAEPKEEAASDSQTAELPKSVLGGKEFAVGDEVVLKINQINEDSVVVSYATEEHDDSKEPPHDESKEVGGMSSLYEDGGGNPGGNPGKY
jgi:hypothetical protein